MTLREELARRLELIALRSESYAGLTPWLLQADECIRQMEWARRLPPSMTVGEILEQGDDFIARVGLNPWCVNEGLADKEDEHPVPLTLAPDGWTPEKP